MASNEMTIKVELQGLDEIEQALKIGARNSAGDADRLQAIHDMAVENGAKCADTYPAMMSMDNGLVTFGASVKALGDGKVGGYLIRFSTDKDPDLTGDFFTPETDFGEHKTADVYYNHGLDATLKTRKIGKADLRSDEVGIWAEAQLALRDEYEQAIYEMAKAGKLGWSSGTASHLMERKAVGKSNLITRWPLGLDASLTPTPAEPRNGAVSIKSLLATAEVSGDTPATVETEAIKSNLTNEVTETMEISEEKLTQMLDAAVLKGVQAAQPPIKSAGFATGAEVAVTKDAADQTFKSFGQFLSAVKNAAFGSEDVRLLPLKAASGLNESIASQGGYLVGAEYANRIIEKVQMDSDILNSITWDDIGPDKNRAVYPAEDETSRADGSQFGGIAAYWLAEAGTKTASKPRFRNMEIVAQKVAALVYATDEMLEDSTLLNSYLGRKVPAALKFKAENAVYRGDGVGKPLGWMASPSLVSVTRDTGSKILAADIFGMWARMWPPCRKNAKWYISVDAETQLLGMYLTSTLAFPWMTVTPSGVLQILGRPVVVSEYASTLNTTGDIMLVDPTQYLGVRKQGIQAASSIHVLFTTDETAFRWVWRIGGKDSWSSPVTQANSSTTLTDIVVLGSAT